MPKFDINRMRERLEAEIESRNRGLAEVSVAAGLNKSYLHGVLRRGQMPTVGRLDAICSELGVSMLYIMYGLDAPDGAEEVFAGMQNDPERFWALMKLI